MDRNKKSEIEQLTKLLSKCSSNRVLSRDLENAYDSAIARYKRLESTNGSDNILVKEILRAIGKNANTPIPILLSIFTILPKAVLKNPVIRSECIFLENPNICKDLLEANKEACSNLKMPTTFYKFLMNNDSAEHHLMLVQNDYTPPDILDKLSKIEALQLDVAEHPNTSSKTLARMSKNKKFEIQLAVARNPNTLPNTVAKLKKNPFLEVLLDRVVQLNPS